MNKDTFIEMIDLETCRQLFLFDKKNKDAIGTMIREIANNRRTIEMEEVVSID